MRDWASLPSLRVRVKRLQHYYPGALLDKGYLREMERRELPDGFFLQPLITIRYLERRLNLVSSFQNGREVTYEAGVSYERMPWLVLASVCSLTHLARPDFVCRLHRWILNGARVVSDLPMVVRRREDETSVPGDIMLVPIHRDPSEWFGLKNCSSKLHREAILCCTAMMGLSMVDYLSMMMVDRTLFTPVHSLRLRSSLECIKGQGERTADPLTIGWGWSGVGLKVCVELGVEQGLKPRDYDPNIVTGLALRQGNF
jgi:hypothetical protein